MARIVHYDRLVRSMFLRRTAHFIRPRILDATTFTFPRASFLHYWKIEDKPYYVPRDLGLFNNTDKVHVASIFEYPEDLETLGKFRSLTFVPNAYVDEFKKILKEWRILKKDQEVPANDRIFKIVNYGALPGKYAYTFNPLNPYYIYKNTFSTVLKNIFLFNDRRSFLILEMPTDIPTRQLLERYMKGLKPAYFRELKSYKHFNFLELYMFIDPEYRSKSVFSLIPKDKWNNLDILFTIDNKIMAVNFNTFLAMIDGTGSFVTGIKSKKPPIFKKIFHKLIQTFIDSHAMTEVELDKLEKELDANPNIENKEDNSTEETTDTPKVEEEPVKPSKPIPRWSLTNKQQDTKPQNLQDILEVMKEKNRVDDDVTNDAPTRDTKKEEDDDGTGDDENDEIEIIDEEEALYDQLVKDINTDRDNIESELDEHDNEEFLLKQQKETVTVTSLDKDLTKTEEQLKEEDETIASLTLQEIEDMQYDYKNVENKIQALLDNKGLDKQKAKKMKDIVDKQMKSKDPYGRNKTIEDIVNSVDDFEIPEVDLKITDNKVVFDKSYNNNTINTIRETYIKNHYHDDIVKMIYSLQNANVIVEEYKINPIKSQLGDLEEHVITLRTLENQTSTVKIMLPKIEPDGIIKMSGNDYVMRWQRQDLPLRKVGNNQVKLTSYYGKYFLEKAYFKTNDIGYYIMNKLAKRYTEGQGIKDLIMLPADNEAVKLPLDYAHFSRYIKSFKFKNYVFNFDYKNRIKLYKDFTPELLETLEKNNTFVLVGVQAGSPILMDYHSRLFKREAGKYIELPDLYELLEIPREEAPIEYSSIKIFKKRIPIVLLLCYYYGLANLLNILKVKYYKIEANKRIQIQPNEYIVRFQDIKLVITRDEGLGDIIISGLLSIHKVIKTVIYKVLNDKSSFSALFSKLEYSILYVNEIKRLETLFVDPITLSILKEQKQPTNFKGLLIKANELLLDDYYKNPHDIDDMCIKGYERIAGLVYADLITALREYDNKSAFSRAKITVKPYNVISQINEDSTTVLMDDLNPISAIKQTEDLSYLGAQGYNKEALAKSSRIYNDSEIGIVSEAAKDNGEVGITAYLTAAPKIKNLRGKTENFEEGKDGLASVYSTSALLSPFGLMDDAKRLNFASIHNSHIIPIQSTRAPYVRTGYEAIIPIRCSNKFVITAEADGVVRKVSKTEVEVDYGKKGTKTYKIKDWTTKEESGACYTHVMVSNVTEKQKVTKDDTLIYDKLFFEPDIFNPARVIYKQGDVITVGLAEIPETYEDSASISHRLNTSLGTVVTKVKSIILQATDNVFDIKVVGDHVEPTDTIMSMTKAGIGDQGIDARTLELLKNLQTSSPKAKIRGEITKIKVLYNCEFTELSKTLQEVASRSDKVLKAETGWTGQITNGSYSTGGRVLQKGEVEIKFYIAVNNGMGIGDKMILSNQLKCTIGAVWDEDITTDDKTEIDCLFSLRSISARIVNSPLLIGTTSMVLEKLTDKALEMYFGK